jgi:anhydro-N-acetylmuramic acid kinase
MFILSDGKRTFDRHGLIARSGKEDEGWVKVRMTHPFVTRKPPKSTGRETFGYDMASSLIKSAQRRNLSVPDMIASFTGMTARTIHRSFRFAPQPVEEVILGGGGRHNVALVNMLRELLAPAKLMTHEDVGLDSDHKEALVFALLAHETWHNRPSTLPELTGGEHPVVLGQITSGANYEALIKATWCT